MNGSQLAYQLRRQRRLVMTVMAATAPPLVIRMLEQGELA